MKKEGNCDTQAKMMIIILLCEFGMEDFKHQRPFRYEWALVQNAVLFWYPGPESNRYDRKAARF